jgi:molybdenum cofactor guanylyltransferase
MGAGVRIFSSAGQPGENRIIPGQPMTLTAVLFVGGESHRMGQDKATLSWAGQPLWQRQIDTLRQIHPSALLLSARSRPNWCPPEFEVIRDEPPARGPLSGLVAALRQIRTSHLLALAIDLPRMSAEHLRMLWFLAAPGSGIIPRTTDYFEPLCAVYPVEALLALGDLPPGNDHSLQSVVRKLLDSGLVQSYVVGATERPLYQNLNTPEDLQIKSEI